MKNKDETVIAALLSGKAPKKYQGKGVVVLKGKIYLLPDDDQKAKEFFDNLIAKNPKATPTLVDVPTHDIYILISTL